MGNLSANSRNSLKAFGSAAGPLLTVLWLAPQCSGLLCQDTRLATVSVDMSFQTLLFCPEWAACSAQLFDFSLQICCTATKRNMMLARWAISEVWPVETKRVIHVMAPRDCSAGPASSLCCAEFAVATECAAARCTFSEYSVHMHCSFDMKLQQEGRHVGWYPPFL